MGLWPDPGTSISDAIDEILSVERPFERRFDGLGAGGGGFWGLRTIPSLSELLQSEDMTSLFPKISLEIQKQQKGDDENSPIGITDLPELESLLGERLWVWLKVWYPAAIGSDGVRLWLLGKVPYCSCMEFGGGGKGATRFFKLAWTNNSSKWSVRFTKN